MSVSANCKEDRLLDKASKEHHLEIDDSSTKEKQDFNFL